MSLRFSGLHFHTQSGSISSGRHLITTTCLENLIIFLNANADTGEDAPLCPLRRAMAMCYTTLSRQALADATGKQRSF